MITIVIVAHPPGITGGKALQLTHRVEDGGSQFAPESRPSTLRVIQEDAADTVGDFTDTDTAESGGNQVVECGRLNLTEELPLQRSYHG